MDKKISFSVALLIIIVTAVLALSGIYLYNTYSNSLNPSGPSAEPLQGQNSQKIAGTITYRNLDGCAWGIYIGSSSGPAYYELANIPEELKKSGTKGEFVLKKSDNQGSVCMLGETVDIISYEIIDDPGTETLQNNCSGQLASMEEMMSGFNYCSVDADCIKKDLGIMDFCGGHLINKDANLGGFNIKLNKYKSDGCFEPINDCQAGTGELKCTDKKCIYKKVTIDSDNNCESLNIQIKDELNSAQKCSVDSECVIDYLGLPCTITICSSAYNKNYDLAKLKSLNKSYKDSDCGRGCPTYYCGSTGGADVKCTNSSCKFIPVQDN